MLVYEVLTRLALNSSLYLERTHYTPKDSPRAMRYSIL